MGTKSNLGRFSVIAVSTIHAVCHYTSHGNYRAMSSITYGKYTLAIHKNVFYVDLLP